MAIMPVNLDTPRGGQADPAVDYARSIDELLKLYTRIDKAAVALPVVAMPGWSREAPRLAIFRSIWMGEFLFPFLSIRPLVTGVLHWHFRTRLWALRQHILRETMFSEDGKAAVARIDPALDFWKRRTGVGPILFTWVLPLAGPVTALWQWLFPSVLLSAPSWTFFAALLSLTYVLLVFSTAFVVKRGLVLGGTGRAAFFPGSLPGQGGYADEKEVLSPLGLAVAREFPLDIVLVVVGFGLAQLANAAWHTGEWNPEKFTTLIAVFSGSLILWGVIGLIALHRRKKLGRC